MNKLELLEWALPKLEGALQHIGATMASSPMYDDADRKYLQDEDKKLAAFRTLIQTTKTERDGYHG